MLIAKHQETKAFLATELRRLRGRNTVVVTHHAPSGQSISPEFKDDPLSGCYASNLEDLIVETQPAVWIHGHVHHKTTTASVRQQSFQTLADTREKAAASSRNLSSRFAAEIDSHCALGQRLPQFDDALGGEK